MTRPVPKLDPRFFAGLAEVPSSRLELGERFSLSAQESLLELLKGITGLGGLAPNRVSEAIGAEQAALDPLPEPQTLGESATDFLGHITPDIGLDVATTPIATGTAVRLAGRGASPLLSILGGEAAQSAAHLPADLLREDRTTGQAIGAAALGTGAGFLLSSLFNRGPLRAIQRAAQQGGEETVEDVIGRAVIPSEAEQLRLPFDEGTRQAFKQDEALAGIRGDLRAAREAFESIDPPDHAVVNGEVQMLLEPTDASDLLGPLPREKIAVRLRPQNPADEVIQRLVKEFPEPKGQVVPGIASGFNLRRVAPEDFSKLSKERQAETLRLMQLTDQIRKEIIAHVGDETPAARFVQHALADEDIVVAFGKGNGGFAQFGTRNAPEQEGIVVPSPTKIGGSAAQTIRHELGHIIRWRAHQFAPERAAQQINERLVNQLLRADRIAQSTDELHAAKTLLHDLRGAVTGGELQGTQREPFRHIMQAKTVETLRQRIRAQLNGAMDAGTEWRTAASTKRAGVEAGSLEEGADELMLQFQELATSYPLGKPSPAGVGRKLGTGTGKLPADVSLLGGETFPGERFGPNIGWGWDEGWADLVDIMMHPREIIDDFRAGLADDLDALFKPSQLENQMLDAARQGDSRARTWLAREGKLGLLDDAGENLQEAARIEGEEGVLLARNRMLRPFNAPTALADGTVIRPGDSISDLATQVEASKWAFTRDEYIERLRQGLQAKGAISHTLDDATPEIRDLIKRATSEKPFRRFKEQEQFQLDTIARRALKREGFTKPQQDEWLARMSPEDRRQVAMGEAIRKQVGPGGAALFDDVLDMAPPGIQLPLAESFEKMVLRMDIANKGRSAEQTMSDLWRKAMFLYKGHLLLHPVTYLGNLASTLSFGALAPIRAGAAAVADVARVAIKGGERTRFAKDMWVEAGAWMNAVMNATSAASKQTPELVELGSQLRRVREGLELKSPFQGPRERFIGMPAEFSYKSLAGADNYMFNKAFDAKILAAAAREADLTGRSAEEVLSDWSRKLVSQMEEADVKIRAEWEEALESGKKAVGPSPAELDAEIIAEFQQLARQNPELAEVVANADFADRLIFTNREARTIDNILDHMWETPWIKNILEPVVPFRRTAANIAREAWRTSPMGFSTAWGRFMDNLGLEGNARKSLLRLAVQEPNTLKQLLVDGDKVAVGQLMDDIGQAIVGTGIGLGLFALMKSKLIEYTPFDRQMPRNERLLREQAGQGTEGVQVGGVSVPVHRLPPPLAEQMRAIDTLLRAQDAGHNISEQFASLLWSFPLNMVDESYIQSLDQLFQAVRRPDAAVQFAGRFAGSFVPRIVTPQTYADLRPEKGEGTTAGVLRNLFRGPAGRLGIGEKQVGPLGQERRRTDILGTGIRVPSDDPVVHELVNNEVFPSLGLPRDLTLTRGQENDALQAKGLFQRSVLQRVIDSPGYQGIQDSATRKVVLERVLRKVNRDANRLISARSQRGMDISFQALLDAFRITGR